MKKIVLSFLLVLNIIIMNVYNVKADVISDLSTYYDTFVKDNVWDVNKWENFMIKALQDIGFISSGHSGGHAFSISKQVLEDNFPNSGIGVNSSVNDVKNWVTNHISVSQNNVSVDNDYRQFITNYVNYELSTDNPYCYTWTKTELSSFVPYVNAYVDLDNVFNDNPNSIFMYWKYNNQNFLGVLDLGSHPYLVCINRSELTNANNERNIMFYDETTALTNWDKVYQFDISSQKWVDSSSGGTQISNNGNNIVKIKNIPQQYTRSYPFLPIFSKESIGLRYFFNVSEVTPQSILYQPYYYNNDVYQDFSTSSGDYVFSPSNINTISYGDTTTYIDSFNREEGVPPSIPQINNYINQQNDQNVNVGGGSGGSGGDSGGSGGDMSIFDFLSRLGEVLGGLIKNLGNMLTSLIEGIVTVITDLLTSIPDTMNTLIGAVFGWLPTELKALFALGISLMVLVGLIRLFKG